MLPSKTNGSIKTNHKSVAKAKSGAFSTRRCSTATCTRAKRTTPKPWYRCSPYYATRLRDALENFALICDSFLTLKQCCTEMSLANRGLSPLQREEEVCAWRQAQIMHQEICVRAHGKQIIRPKHHHRLHLPSHALQLGCVPDCSIQEKKHQILKSCGLVDRQKGKLSNYVETATVLDKTLT